MNDDRVAHKQLVTTIREKCRMCYTCVRECPVKAIRDPRRPGERHPDALHRLRQLRHRLQPERQAGAAATSTTTERLLAGPAQVAAIVAPSYPAEFTECATATLVGALRDLGFASRPRGRLRRRPGRPRLRALLATTDDGAPHRHHLPGRRLLRAQVPPRPARQPGADRLADDRHGARPAPAPRARHARSSSSAPASPRRARPPTSSSTARSTPC